MKIKTKVLKGEYIDSVTLMLLTTRANEIEGVKQALIGMGSDMNHEVLQNLNIATAESKAASSNDLMIVVAVEDEKILDKVFEQVEQILEQRNANQQDDDNTDVYHSQDEIDDDDSQLVVISVPGQYAVREAHVALDKNKNIMLFSDNISVEDEIELKQKAISKNLLLMGPDCGTAIINDVKLCFANEVRSGKIALIAASGTGSQEISVKIHEYGGGISQLIGVGGRDLSAQVGGLMTLHALEMLKNDDDTETIVVVSKAPAPEVAKKVLSILNEIKDKKIIVCFMGATKDIVKNYPNVQFAGNTKEAALKAVGLTKVPQEYTSKIPKYKFNKNQNKVVGIFAGGTLCDETFFQLKFANLEIYSNNSKDPKYKLKDASEYNLNKIIDFGADEYTRGKAHPMIDPSIRNDYLKKVVKDESVAVILMDFVLGYGSNPEPVKAMLPAILEAKKELAKQKREVAFVAYVLGTENDIQNKTEQIKLLEEQNIVVAPSSVDISKITLEILNQRKD